MSEAEKTQAEKIVHEILSFGKTYKQMYEITDKIIQSAINTDTAALRAEKEELLNIFPPDDMVILANNVKGKRFKEPNNIQLGASLDTLCDRVIKAAAILKANGRGE